MKRIMSRAILLFGFLLITTMAVASPSKTVRIGMVIDGPWPRYPGIINQFQNEIQDLARGEVNVVFPDNRVLSGNWQKSNITDHLKNLQDAGDVDLIVTLGFSASHLACQMPQLKKPVVAGFVLDDTLQNLPNKKGKSGIRNLNYINALKRISRDIDQFSQLVPATHMAVLVDSLLMETMPEFVEKAKKTAEKNGKKFTFIPVYDRAEPAIEALPEGIEAVLVPPLFRLTETETVALAHGLKARQLPSLVVLGRQDLDLGFLATMTPGNPLEHLARSTAINVMEIIRGESAANLPVAFNAGDEMAINMATARAIDVSPSWDLLTDAVLVDDYISPNRRTLTLKRAVAEALAANRDLQVSRKSVDAGEQLVSRAKSTLLPQLSISTQASIIDDDTAEAAMGASPEKVWTGSAVATQLIYSDKAWTGYTVEKYNQKARKEEYQASVLDTSEAAAIAYLNVLRADTAENIRKTNLKLTRANLERARVRVAVGQAGPSEEYRWETEIATQRKEVLSAESLTLDAMSEMNRVLNRPLQESFDLAETGVSGPESVIQDKRLMKYLKTPRQFEELRRYLIHQGLTTSPEIQVIDSSMAALERTRTMAQREYWLPTFALVGSAGQRFASDGAGTSYPPTLPVEPDDTTWSVGINANLPLFTGGKRTAELRQTREEIDKLSFQRQSVSERINQRVHISMNRVRASYPGIRLSKQAADAARKNLDIVIGSYERGVLSIIDLLDAQSLSFNADQVAANAVFDFLSDLMTLQRASGDFFLLANDQKRDEWFESAAAYLSTSEKK